jgi:hypothetical protein
MRAKHILDSHAELAITKKVDPVGREEYLDYMTFRRLIPPLLTEIFGPLPGLKAEWAAQGASPAELDFSAFRYRCCIEGGLPVNLGWMGGEREEVLEETEEHIIARDRMGRRVKLCKGAATLPLPLDYPVANMDDWLKVRHHYEFTEERLAGEWERRAGEHLKAGRVITVGMPGGFDEPRQLMGDELTCVAYYDQPEVIHDMLATMADTAYKVLERVTAVVPLDELAVHEDMAGKGGPLAGPRQVREFIGPYYRRVWDMVRDRGTRLLGQDSDGNMNAVIPAFLEHGLNLMHPMEPAAGMDIVAARGKYGTRLAFMGGIDKHVLRRSKEEIVAELEYKIPPMVRTGGCVLGLDHRIPGGTPLEHYHFYLRKAWEIMEAESRSLGLG